MAKYRLPYDLHMHSCLSPCGDMDMTPGNIAGMCAIKELKIIALTDHNTGRNVPALMKTAEQYGLIVIPGMELTTMEEVHVVCLFPDVEKLLDFDAYVYEHLIKIKNKPEFFGEQVQMNEDDEPVAEEPYLLINATDISFDASYRLVKEFGGLAIPAHLDKTTTSLISNLGFIPPDSEFRCVEIKDPANTEQLLQDHPYLKDCRIITDSDAHQLGDIAEPVRFLEFDTEEPDAADVLKLLAAPSD